MALFQVPIETLKEHLIVPDDFWETWEEKRKNCNGCGSGWNAKLVPDTIYGLNIRLICCIHDADYEIGGTELEKNIADIRFKKNLKKTIELFDKWYYPTSLAKTRAYEYYYVVKKIGYGSFNFTEEVLI